MNEKNLQNEPQGEDYAFELNEVISSSLKDIFLKRSKMIDCVMNETNIQGLKLVESQFVRLKALNSFIENMAVTRGDLLGLHLKETCFSKVQIQQARWQSSRFENSSLVEVLIGQAQIENAEFENSHLTQFELQSSNMLDCFFKSSMFSQVEMDQSELKNVTFTGCRFSDVRMKNVNLQNIKISGVELSNVRINGNDQFLQLVGHN